jgi:hypothetical protein
MGRRKSLSCVEHRGHVAINGSAAAVGGTGTVEGLFIVVRLPRKRSLDSTEGTQDSGPRFRTNRTHSNLRFPFFWISVKVYASLPDNKRQ